MYTGLLLGSGGARGYLIIGALKYLMETRQLTNVKHICGVSIGAVIGFLYLIGCLPSDMLRIDLNNYPTAQGSEFLSIVQSLLSRGYLYQLEPIIEQINEYSAKHNFRNVSFKELYEYKEIKLTVVAYDVSNAKPLYFSYETYPDMPCVEAIKLSCAVPVFFNPQHFPGDKNRMVIDGGFYTSTPFEVFNDDDEIIALLTEPNLENYANQLPILQRVMAIFKSLDISNQQLHESIAKCKITKKVLIGKHLGLPGILSERQRDELYMEGYLQMIK